MKYFFKYRIKFTLWYCYANLIFKFFLNCYKIMGLESSILQYRMDSSSSHADFYGIIKKIV
jgi:hypothetical protein